MDKIIKKHRIKKNNIEFVLFEKEPDITSENVQINEIVLEDLISPPSLEYSFLGYDFNTEKIEWKNLPPPIEYDLDPLYSTNKKFEDKFENLKKQQKIIKLYSEHLQLPFAVKNNKNDFWGGPGKAGIFWQDPGEIRIDNYSIKVGTDNVEIGETGYTYGDVSNLAMKFSMGAEAGRGFVWNRVGGGYSNQPVMALNSSNGNLTVRGNINSDEGRILSGGVNISTLFGNADVDRITQFNGATEWSTGSTLTISDRWSPENDSTWTFVNPGDGITYHSGIIDFTIYWDETEHVYHIIGIRSITDPSDLGPLAFSSTTHFLWATTSALTSGSYIAHPNSGIRFTQFNGIIDSITGIEDAGHPADFCWAPHLFKYDGAYYMFYTGCEDVDNVGINNRNTRQRIFVAKSYDLNNWDAPEIKFCFDASGVEWSPYDSGIDWRYQCRDPFVIFDEDYNRWLCFVTVQVKAAYSDSGNLQGVVGIASASTLMGDWTLYDWIRATEYDACESTQVFKGPDNLWYLHATVDDDAGPYADQLQFFSSTTLSDVTGYTRLDYMTKAGAAAEILPHPNVDNLWIFPSIYVYDYSPEMQSHDALTFSGAGNTLCYTGHQAMAVTASTAHTRIQSNIDHSDILFGHKNEKNIHYDVSELDRRYLPIDFDISSLSSITADITAATASVVYGNTPAERTFSAGTYAFPDALLVNDDLYVNNDGGGGSVSKVWFNTGATATSSGGSAIGWGAGQMNIFVDQEAAIGFGGKEFATDGSPTNGYDVYLNANAGNTTRIWFGNSVGGYNTQQLTYNTTNQYFSFNDDLNTDGTLRIGNGQTYLRPSGYTLLNDETVGYSFGSGWTETPKLTLSNGNWITVQHPSNGSGLLVSGCQLVCEQDIFAGNMLFVNTNNYDQTLHGGKIYWGNEASNYAGFLKFHTGTSEHFEFSTGLTVTDLISGLSLIHSDVGYTTDGYIQSDNYISINTNNTRQTGSLFFYKTTNYNNAYLRLATGTSTVFDLSHGIDINGDITFDRIEQNAIYSQNFSADSANGILFNGPRLSSNTITEIGFPSLTDVSWESLTNFSAATNGSTNAKFRIGGDDVANIHDLYLGKTQIRRNNAYSFLEVFDPIQINGAIVSYIPRTNETCFIATTENPTGKTSIKFSTGSSVGSLGHQWGIYCEPESQILNDHSNYNFKVGYSRNELWDILVLSGADRTVGIYNSAPNYTLDVGTYGGADGSIRSSSLTSTTINAEEVDSTQISINGTNIDSLFADISHTHGASEITPGTFGTGDYQIIGDLSALTHYVRGNIYVDYLDNASNDHYIYFHDNLTSDGAYIHYFKNVGDSANGYFDLSHHLNVGGYLTATGNISGGTFTANTSGIKTVGGLTGSTDVYFKNGTTFEFGTDHNGSLDLSIGGASTTLNDLWLGNTQIRRNNSYGFLEIFENTRVDGAVISVIDSDTQETNFICSTDTHTGTTSIKFSTGASVSSPVAQWALYSFPASEDPPDSSSYDFKLSYSKDSSWDVIYASGVSREVGIYNSNPSYTLDVGTYGGADGTFNAGQIFSGGTDIATLFSDVSHTQNASTIEAGTFSGSAYVFCGSSITPLTVGGDKQRTVLKIEATDTAGESLTTTELVMEGYENRGNGIFIYNGDVVDSMWFAGSSYNSDNYTINYSAITAESDRNVCRNIDGTTHPIFNVNGANRRVGINNNSPSYDLDVNGAGRFTSDLTANGHLIADGNVYVNNNGTAGDSSLFFHDGSTTTGGYVRFNNTTDEFTLSHTLNVVGNIDSTALITSNTGLYTDGNVLVNYNGTVTASAYLGFHDSTSPLGAYLKFNNTVGASAFTLSHKLTVNGSVSASTYSGISLTKGITVLEPQTNDEVTLMWVDRDISILSANTVVRGTSPTLNWSLLSGSSRDSGVSFGSGTADSTTVGSGHTSTAVVPANNWIWLQVTSTGGTSVDEFHLTMKYRED